MMTTTATQTTTTTITTTTTTNAHVAATRRQPQRPVEAYICSDSMPHSSSTS
jgi:hypothetical protein